MGGFDPKRCIFGQSGAASRDTGKASQAPCEVFTDLIPTKDIPTKFQVSEVKVA